MGKIDRSLPLYFGKKIKISYITQLEGGRELEI
jgi:hypothetical protein